MKKKPARVGFIGVHSRNWDKAAAFADTHRGSVFNELNDLLK